MKTVYKIFIAIVLIFSCNLNFKASTILINVEDFEFNPGDFTINIGDTIKWAWDNSAGMHTTASTSIPAGALPWDQEISSLNPVFTYIPTIAGSYSYICSQHFSTGMFGHFTVLPASGIIEKWSGASFELNITNPVIEEFQLVYNIPETTLLKIRMFNILGEAIYSFVSTAQVAGKYSHTYMLPSLSKGMYLITLETKDRVLSKKVLLQ
ncbi:MAG: hypothetical protein A3F72_18920 [Bacteroidetes bacterium RIFCSPLOWO2_12_FULL_35_15]|nr:MAG: hypothetical protein A3F72_18920 [Bacteroidetes bacterium RIFCSPLOWO2_12_FULL_35_15]